MKWAVNGPSLNIGPCRAAHRAVLATITSRIVDPNIPSEIRIIRTRVGLISSLCSPLFSLSFPSSFPSSGRIEPSRPPIDLFPSTTTPRFLSRAPSPTPPPSSPTPGRASPQPNQRASTLLRPVTIGAVRSSGPPSICSLRPFPLAPDPKNRFSGEPSIFPALFLVVSSPERYHTPPARRRPPRSGSFGLGPDHPAPSRGKKYCLVGSSGLGSDHPISTDL